MTDSKRVTREGLAAALHETARPRHIGKLPDLTACTGTAVHMADAASIFDALPDEPEPTCCELACYEDPGCSCEGCIEVTDIEATVDSIVERYGSDLDALAQHPATPPASAEADDALRAYFWRCLDDLDSVPTDTELERLIAAIRAESSLDVERLARAIHVVTGLHTDHTGPVCPACSDDAADYAAEYAR